jgi:hypothetical protein
MKSDSRKAKRKPVHYPAWIEREGKDLGECQLSDVSDGGARLLVPSPDDIPETFTLRLSSRGTSKRNCRVVWRSDTEVGIEFDKTKPGARKA